MAVIAYKWGGISFDDKSLIKLLTLPSDADDAAPITFHDEAANNYQVPGGKVFVAGVIAFATSNAGDHGQVGESDGVDGAITKEIIRTLSGVTNDIFEYKDVLAVYTATKYITGKTEGLNQLLAGATLFGVEIDA